MKTDFYAEYLETTARDAYLEELHSAHTQLSDLYEEYYLFDSVAEWREWEAREAAIADDPYGDEGRWSVVETDEKWVMANIEDSYVTGEPFGPSDADVAWFDSLTLDFGDGDFHTVAWRCGLWVVPTNVTREDLEAGRTLDEMADNIEYVTMDTFLREW